jgi:hypothetical protein
LVDPCGPDKTKLDFEVPLSRAALGLLHEARRVKLGGHVFTTNGNRPINNFSAWKAQMDRLMLAELRKIAVAYCGSDAGVELARWTIHDLRRTARSLMSQAGVDPDHAERALGHTIGGVRGVYDRHALEMKSGRRSRRWRRGSSTYYAPCGGRGVSLESYFPRQMVKRSRFHRDKTPAGGPRAMDQSGGDGTARRGAFGVVTRRAQCADFMRDPPPMVCAIAVERTPFRYCARLPIAEIVT